MKTCEYCLKTGPAYTFTDGETICPECFKSMPVGISALRRALHTANKEIESLRQQLESRTCAIIVHRCQALACSEKVAASYNELRQQLAQAE